MVGASLAGLCAARSARVGGWRGRITLVGAEQHLPYDRTQLSAQFLDGGDEVPAPLRTRDFLEFELGIELALGEPATALDGLARTVRVGADRTIPYDACIIATGASARQLPGAAGIRGVHVLRTREDAQALRAALDSASDVVVVGAGLMGSEVASAARRRGLAVTVVDRAELPLSRSLTAGPAEMCAELHRCAGTRLRLGVGVRSVEQVGGRVSAVVLDDGERLPADVVVVGIGTRPTTAWLQSSGIELHPRDGGVVCNAFLCTSLPDVWAAGAVAHFPNIEFGDRTTRLEYPLSAAEQGGFAGAHATGVPVDLYATIPSFHSDLYGHRLQLVGLAEGDEVAHVGPPGPGAVVLYRAGDRLVGAFTLDRCRDVTRLRRHIAALTPWDRVVADVATAMAPV